MCVTHAVKYSPFTMYIIFRIIDKNKTVWFCACEGRKKKWTTKVLVWHFCYISISICAWVRVWHIYSVPPSHLRTPDSLNWKNMENSMSREDISIRTATGKIFAGKYSKCLHTWKIVLILFLEQFFPLLTFIVYSSRYCMAWHGWYSHAIFHKFSHNQYTYPMTFYLLFYPLFAWYTCVSECAVWIVCDIEMVQVQTVQFQLIP